MLACVALLHHACRRTSSTTRQVPRQRLSMLVAGRNSAASRPCRPDRGRHGSQPRHQRRPSMRMSPLAAQSAGRRKQSRPTETWQAGVPSVAIARILHAKCQGNRRYTNQTKAHESLPSRAIGAAAFTMKWMLLEVSESQIISDGKGENQPGPISRPRAHARSSSQRRRCRSPSIARTWSRSRQIHEHADDDIPHQTHKGGRPHRRNVRRSVAFARSVT
jgi:hypothetical protein